MQDTGALVDLFKYDAAAYGWLSLLATVLIEVVKRMFPGKVAGKEALLAFCFIMAAGVGAKLTPSLGFYQDMPWFVHSVALLLTVGAAFKAHDWFVNPLMGKRDPAATPPGNNPSGESGE